MLEKQLEMMKEKLRAAGLYPLKAEAELSTQILKERLAQVLPWAMEQAGVDFWAVIARENHEDPLHRTLYTWASGKARQHHDLYPGRGRSGEKVLSGHGLPQHDGHL